LEGFVKQSVAWIVASFILCTSAVRGGPPEPAASARPPLFAKLIECRSIKEDAARLACYDAQTAALDEAERKNEVMVVDRQQIKKAKRGLFGLALPSIGGLFGKDNEQSAAEEQLDSIDSTITGLGSTQSGKLIFTIEGGARWVQTDSTSIRTPKVGQLVKIKKAAMGSYFAVINGQRTMRVRREN
jgi:hypothetical protein